MITAVVLIQTKREEVNSVGEKLAEIDGVVEVYSVSGHYDLIAIMRLETNEKLAELMTEKLTGVKGITDTESMIAFRKISKKDISFG
ncbi:MAG: Lrp/AsnC family transcriptional regulator [Tangfeifania sp.]